MNARQAKKIMRRWLRVHKGGEGDYCTPNGYVGMMRACMKEGRKQRAEWAVGARLGRWDSWPAVQVKP